MKAFQLASKAHSIWMCHSTTGEGLVSGAAFLPSPPHILEVPYAQGRENTKRKEEISEMLLQSEKRLSKNGICLCCTGLDLLPSLKEMTFFLLFPHVSPAKPTQQERRSRRLAYFTVINIFDPF